MHISFYAMRNTTVRPNASSSQHRSLYRYDVIIELIRGPVTSVSAGLIASESSCARCCLFQLCRPEETLRGEGPNYIEGALACVSSRSRVAARGGRVRYRGNSIWIDISLPPRFKETAEQKAHGDRRTGTRASERRERGRRTGFVLSNSGHSCF